jgi:2-haloacid dehalogenase
MTNPERALPSAVAFDAYGTLFDIHAPMTRLAAEIGPNSAAISDLWRQKQLQYTWLRSLMGAHADFWQITQDALDYALDAHGIEDQALRARLLDLYLHLDAYGDAAPLLSALRQRGMATAILSNGSPDMLRAATRSSGLAPLLDHILSIEAAGIYKPAAPAYQLAVDAFGIPAGQIGFVSANAWDVAGAAHFGFAVYHLDRFCQGLERLPARPLTVIKSLSDLPGQIVA